jgi:hypothetical protein
MTSGDLHAESGRWWIVTKPTNLYSQADFKSRDVVLTFHVGGSPRCSAGSGLIGVAASIGSSRRCDRWTRWATSRRWRAVRSSRSRPRRSSRRCDVDGQLHFRRTGGRAFVREPGGDRRLFAAVLRWDQPVKLSTGGQECSSAIVSRPVSRPCWPSPMVAAAPARSSSGGRRCWAWTRRCSSTSR